MYWYPSTIELKNARWDIEILTDVFCIF